MNRTVAVVLCVLASATLAGVGAEEPSERGPLTWIAYSEVRTGKTDEAVALTLEDEAFYDGLVDRGVIRSWGLFTPINHRPGDGWNHGQWVTVDSWAKIDEWVGAFMQYVQTLGDDARAAREERAKAIFVDGSHWDAVVRHHVHETSGTAPRYFVIADLKAEPGQGPSIVQLYREWVAPVADRLRDEGVLAGYGLYEQELHGLPGWTHGGWYALPGLASLDRLQAAFEEAGGPAVQAWVERAVDMEAHADRILMVLHYGGPAAQE